MKGRKPHAAGGRAGFAGGGLTQAELIQLYVNEGMSLDDATAAASASSNLPWEMLT